MLLVGGRPKARQRLERSIPYPELAPPREAHEYRIPIAVSLGHVAPRRSGAQNPKDAVDRSPLVRDRWATLAAIRQQWIETAPFHVRQIAPTQCCLLPKGSLESKLDSSVKNRQHGLGRVGRDHPDNGILLRADIHILFDRGLLAVNPNTRRLWVAPELGSSGYAKLNDRLVKTGAAERNLRWHFEWARAKASKASPTHSDIA